MLALNAALNKQNKQQCFILIQTYVNQSDYKHQCTFATVLCYIKEKYIKK